MAVQFRGIQEAVLSTRGSLEIDYNEKILRKI